MDTTVRKDRRMVNDGVSAEEARQQEERVYLAGPPMKRKLLITGIVIGVILMLGPLWGLLATVIGMMGAFKILGSDGVNDPNALSHHIGMQLMGTTLGLVACPIGIVLFAACIAGLVLDKRPPPPLPPAT
jgi:biopolymer transport protein ExbB/TolQ